MAALRCLLRQDYPNFHLELIDAASTDGKLGQLRETFPDLDVRCLPQNMGYTGGNNTALRRGLAEGYDYVLLANPDIEVGQDALSRLVATAEADPHSGVAGGWEKCFYTGAERALGGRAFSLWRGRAKWITGLEGRDNARGAVAFVHGAFVLFSRRALEKDIFFDEQLFLYYDEADLGFQLKNQGLKAWVDPQVAIRHKNKVKHFNAVVEYFLQRNRLYMVRKHGAWFHRFFFGAYILFFELPLKFVWRGFQGRSAFLRACALGFWDGFRGQMGSGRLGQL